jgi:peptidoglycan/xylan/chitin deacetylase (PgdA/CDA1 family)
MVNIAREEKAAVQGSVRQCNRLGARSSKTTVFARTVAALVVGLAATLFGALPARAATDTVVSLTFDDGQASQYAVASRLQARGMRGTFYINSAMVGTGAYYMTWTQIRDIYKAGHEIGGHTLHHTNLTTVSISQATTEVCDDRSALIARGFGPVTAFAYPEAAVDSTAESIVKSCGYTSGRPVGNLYSSTCPCPYAETIPQGDPYNLRTVDGATRSTTLQDLQTAVSDAEERGGGWVILIFHGICNNACTAGNTVTTRTFNAFLDWLRPRSAHGTVVRTVGEVTASGGM